MTEPTASSSAIPSTDGAVDGGVLDALLARLSQIDDVPLDERPALFEEANEVLVAALADLEEV